MKFTISQDEFASLAGWAASALAARPAVPVAGGILITAAAGSIAVTGTDYDTTCRAHAVADVEVDGQALVPGKFLANVAANLPKKEPVTVDANIDGGVVTITCGPARWTLPMMMAEEYPSMPEMPPAVATLTAADFAEAVAAVTCAASTDDTLPMLTCVVLEVGYDGDGGTVTLVATDRYRLHVATIPATIDGEPPAAPLLIPARVLSAYTKGADGKITLCAGDGETTWAGFADGGRMLLTRPVAGDFVAWRNRFSQPSDKAFTVTLDTALTMGAADRCALAADKGTGLELEFSGGGTVNVSAAGNHGSAGTEAVTGVGYDGSAFTMRINPKYFIDVLGGCGPRAAITITSPAKPIVVTPAQPGDDETPGIAGDPLEASFAGLVVPIRPQS